MKVSKDLMEFLESWEGLSLVPYRCQAGILTIGIGTTRPFGKPLDPNLRITKEEAYEMKMYDMRRFEKTVNSFARKVMEQHEFDAFVSLAYNIGETAFSESTALRRFNEGNTAGAADAILWWGKVRNSSGDLVASRGLRRRREAEKELFLHGVYRKNT
jgi:lysozyme